MPRYTAKQKAQAIQAWQKHGTAEASRQTGISTTSITRWVRADPDVVQTNAKQTEKARLELARRTRERREQVRALLMEKVLDLLERMDKEHVDFKAAGNSGPVQVTYPIATSGDVKNYAIAMAVLLDKYRLEAGESTDRVEHISPELAASVLDEEIADLLTQMPDAG
jgi:hypothetical protein